MRQQEADTSGSLRRRQKERRRATILNVARQLFREQGFQATSMETIAAQAEVGVATVYNYFGTKGGLLAELLRPEFRALHEQGATVISRAGEDPVAGVLRLVAIYRHFQNDWSSRKLLAAVIGPGLTSEPVLDDLSTEAESQVKEQLRDLMERYREAGLIRADVDTCDAALIVFAIFNQHFIEYVTHEAVSYPAMAEAMERQIALFVTAVSDCGQPENCL